MSRLYAFVIVDRKRTRQPRWSYSRMFAVPSRATSAVPATQRFICTNNLIHRIFFSIFSSNRWRFLLESPPEITDEPHWLRGVSLPPSCKPPERISKREADAYDNNHIIYLRRKRRRRKGKIDLNEASQPPPLPAKWYHSVAHLFMRIIHIS